MLNHLYEIRKPEWYLTLECSLRTSKTRCTGLSSHQLSWLWPGGGLGGRGFQKIS